MPPKVVAGMSASVPLNLPMGVRAADTMNTCPFEPLRPLPLSVTGSCYDRPLSPLRWRPWP